MEIKVAKEIQQEQVLKRPVMEACRGAHVTRLTKAAAEKAPGYLKSPCSYAAFPNSCWRLNQKHTKTKQKQTKTGWQTAKQKNKTLKKKGLD